MQTNYPSLENFAQAMAEQLEANSYKDAQGWKGDRPEGLILQLERNLLALKFAMAEGREVEQITRAVNIANFAMMAWDVIGNQQTQRGPAPATTPRPAPTVPERTRPMTAQTLNPSSDVEMFDNAALIKALESHGSHHADCASYKTGPYKGECDCGLIQTQVVDHPGAALLAELERYRDFTINLLGEALDHNEANAEMGVTLNRYYSNLHGKVSDQRKELVAASRCAVLLGPLVDRMENAMALYEDTGDGFNGAQLGIELIPESLENWNELCDAANAYDAAKAEAGKGVS